MGKTKERLTVLFFDLAEWYLKSQGKDASALADELDAFYSEVLGMAASHEGRVVKFMGDAGLVLFSRLDDALSFARGIRSSHKASVGIEKGEVVTGKFGRKPLRWFDAVGPAVNEAAINMRRSAKVEKIVLGPKAWHELASEQDADLVCSDVR